MHRKQRNSKNIWECFLYLLSGQYSSTLSFLHLSYIFLSTLDLGNIFVLVALMKQITVFHFCIFYFSAFIFPKTNINTLLPKSSNRGTPSFVSKGSCFSFCFLSRPQGKYIPVFVRPLSVHLLLLYSYNWSNVYFPFRKSPLLLLLSRPAPRTVIWTVASIVPAVFFQGGS